MAVGALGAAVLLDLDMHVIGYRVTNIGNGLSCEYLLTGFRCCGVAPSLLKKLGTTSATAVRV